MLKITEDRKMEIDLVQLFEQMDDEDKEKIIESLAWESPLYNAIGEIVRNEYAAPRYNNDLFRLRVEFLTGEGREDRIKDVVEKLLRENKKLEANLDLWKNAYRENSRWLWSEHQLRAPASSPDLVFPRLFPGEVDAVIGDALE